jgi:L-fucose mutarotase/ribose pyranase (RbsD/FucU family)
MLKTLSALHTPELLHVLALMGHGDEVALVDCNFPAASMAQRLVRLDGACLPAALEACMQLLPLDTFVDKPAFRMMQVHAPGRGSLANSSVNVRSKLMPLSTRASRACMDACSSRRE